MDEADAKAEAQRVSRDTLLLSGPVQTGGMDDEWDTVAAVGV